MKRSHVTAFSQRAAHLLLLRPFLKVFCGVNVIGRRNLRGLDRFMLIANHNSHFDVILVVVFALFGYAMRLLGFSPAPLLLGLVLGPLMEEHMRRALILSHGDFMTFVNRPVAGSFMAFTFLILVYAAWTMFRDPEPSG